LRCKQCSRTECQEPGCITSVSKKKYCGIHKKPKAEGSDKPSKRQQHISVLSYFAIKPLGTGEQLKDKKATELNNDDDGELQKSIQVLPTERVRKVKVTELEKSVLFRIGSGFKDTVRTWATDVGRVMPYQVLLPYISSLRTLRRCIFLISS